MLTIMRPLNQPQQPLPQTLHFLNMMISSPSINCYNNGENFNECNKLTPLADQFCIDPNFWQSHFFLRHWQNC